MISGAYALVWAGCDVCQKTLKLELSSKPATIALFEMLSPDYVCQQAAEKDWHLTEEGVALCPDHRDTIR